MAMTKTAVDLIGTSGAKTNLAGGASSTSSSRNASTLVGIMIQALATYGGSAPTTQPLVEVFTSSDDTNYDTEAYESFYLPTANSTTKQASIPVRFAEDVKYYKVKVTNGAANAADFWVAAVEVAL
ncbi:MAG: hypothetical protein K8I29_19505 [Alphaproteobacteria bacterium]|uniref:Uncharacterized protein n=1 Tax=Candidatus Nitrobium versatile TaxID=2884831 RepID=A0A953M3N7_9BACT|nr:hypothetical protein [Candidatus Nitrobium versatile]